MLRIDGVAVAPLPRELGGMKVGAVLTDSRRRAQRTSRGTTARESEHSGHWAEAVNTRATWRERDNLVTHVTTRDMHWPAWSTLQQWRPRLQQPDTRWEQTAVLQSPCLHCTSAASQWDNLIRVSAILVYCIGSKLSQTHSKNIFSRSTIIFRQFLCRSVEQRGGWNNSIMWLLKN